jgi:hypothetical protein
MQVKTDYQNLLLQEHAAAGESESSHETLQINSTRLVIL